MKKIKLFYQRHAEWYALFFHIGDQLLQMNNKKLSSVEDLIAVMKETDLGSLLSFEVKRPKKAKHYWESKFAPRKPKKKQKYTR